VASLAAAPVLVLLAGASGISWKWAEAVDERRQADAERDKAEGQRLRAERNFRGAREAVDAYLTSISEYPQLKAHAFEPLRRERLHTARDFYERLVAEEPDHAEARAELARAHGRLGMIIGILESRPQGLAHYRDVEFLRQASAGNYFSAPSTRYLLSDERALDPLRSRADFQKLVAEAKPRTKT
jgi:hypothetical protein